MGVENQAKCGVLEQALQQGMEWFPCVGVLRHQTLFGLGACVLTIPGVHKRAQGMGDHDVKPATRSAMPSGEAKESCG